MDSVEDVEIDPTETLDLVDDVLPDDAEIDAEGLMCVLNSTATEYKQHWTWWAIDNVLYMRQLAAEAENNTIEGGEIQSEPIETIEAILELSEFVQVPPDDPIGMVDPHRDTPEGEAIRHSIQQSWDTTITDDLTGNVVFDTAGTPNDSDVNIEQLLSDRDLNTTGKQLRSSFQQLCFAVSLVLMHQEMAQSKLTAREFVSYHLCARFSTDKASQIATSIFDTDISTGAIRSNISRSKEKYNAAVATTNIASRGQLAAEIEVPDTSDNSFLTTEVAQSLAQYIAGVLASRADLDEPTERTWNLKSGIELTVSVDPDGDTILVQVYVSASTLDESVTVTFSEIEHELVTPREDETQPVSNFGTISNTHRNTSNDIFQAIMRGINGAEVQLGIRDLNPLTSKLIAMGAFEYSPTGSDDAGSVQFYKKIEF
jgi:hypothetical protein